MAAGTRARTRGVRVGSGSATWAGRRNVEADADAEICPYPYRDGSEEVARVDLGFVKMRMESVLQHLRGRQHKMKHDIDR
jgi:hypothetical protein